MKTSRTMSVLFAAIVSGALATNTWAHGDLGGMLVYVDNGKIITGHYDAHGGTGLVTDPGPTYVYVAELENNWETGGTPGINEPGFVTDGASTADPDGQNYLFPANTALTLTANILPTIGVNAAYWDGAGSVSFSASPHEIVIEDAFDSITLDATGTSPIDSVNPWISDANGIGHGHLDFMLNEPDATAMAGVYLFSFTLYANGVQSSEPLYLIMGYGLEEPLLDDAIENAEAWVCQNLVPEPASFMLGVIGTTALFARRRG